MEKETVISVRDIYKTFRVYTDRSENLKELTLHRKRHRYETHRVINGISFDIRRGEAVGLIGHNGCGKSTTLKMLTRIMYPDKGEIEIRGRVSSLIELGAGFHPDMSGRENIYINAAIFGLKKAEIDRRLNDIIAFSELEEYIDNPVRTYSSGMYMRLAFSVAINVDADVLLIDEILAVGDTNFQAKCFDKLQNLKYEGVTVVIVSHDMAAMKSFCDRCIWINDGVIAKEGDAMTVTDAYLSEMNAIRNEQMKADEEQPDYAFENTETHFGNAKVVIEKLEMLNSQRQPTRTIDANEPFFLRYTYKVNKNPGKMIVGMGIFTLDGAWVFGTNSAMSGVEIRVNNERGVVEMQCSPSMLMDGEYRLQVSVIEENSDPMDYHQDYLHFRVMSEKKRMGVGIVYYDTAWRVIE